MKLIGLTGYSGAGKNAVANCLKELYGYEVIAFADPLREMLYEANPIVGVYPEPVQESGTNYVYLREVIDRFGWEGYKNTRFKSEVRRLMQRLGTEGGRKVLGEDVWVNETMERARSKEKVCITDIRFYNEFREVALNKGHVWRVERPGVEALNAHESESYINKFPVNEIIYNGGTLSDLGYQVARKCPSMLQ